MSRNYVYMWWLLSIVLCFLCVMGQNTTSDHHNNKHDEKRSGKIIAWVTGCVAVVLLLSRFIAWCSKHSPPPPPPLPADVGLAALKPTSPNRACAHEYGKETTSQRPS